jgi:hypothetical protein
MRWLRRLLMVVLIASAACDRPGETQISRRSPSPGHGADWGAAQTPIVGEATGLLRYAPPGTWGVLVIDLPRLRALPPSTATFDWRWTRLESPAVRSIAQFLLPGRDEHGFPRRCALIALRKPSRQQAEEECLRLGGRPILEEPAVYAGAREGFATIVADDTILFGTDRKALEALREADSGREAAPLKPRLAELIGPFVDEPLWGGVVLPRSGKRFPIPYVSEDVNPLLFGLAGSSYAVGIGDQVRVRASIRYGNSSRVQAVHAQITRMLAERESALPEVWGEEVWLGPLGQTAREMLRKMHFSVDGSTLELSCHFTHAELHAFEEAFAEFGRMSTHDWDRHRREDIRTLQTIGRAVDDYRAGHDGAYPPDLEVLYRLGHLDRREFFISPVSDRLTANCRWGDLHRYRYVGLLPSHPHPDVIVCCTEPGFYSDGRHVLRVYGTIEWVSEDDLHDPDPDSYDSLRRSHGWLVEDRGDQLTDEDRQRLREFYEIGE